MKHTTDSFDTIKQLIEHNPVEFIRMAGIKAEVVEDRHIRCVLPATKLHKNHVGIMYAGSYFVFAESTGAAFLRCVYGPDYIPILKNVAVDYLRPCDGDLIIDAKMTDEALLTHAADMAYIDTHGKGRFLLNVSIQNAGGDVVCTAAITYYLMKNTVPEAGGKLGAP